MSATIIPFLEDRAQRFMMQQRVRWARHKTKQSVVCTTWANHRWCKNYLRSAFEIAKTGERELDRIYKRTLAAFGLVMLHDRPRSVFQTSKECMNWRNQTKASAFWEEWHMC